MKTFALLVALTVASHTASQAAEAAAEKPVSAPADAAPGEPGDVSENEFLNSINWLKGPAKADLKDIATVNVPEGYMMTAAQGTRDLLEAMGNPTDGTELGFLTPTNLTWFVVFEFADVGYVKDDDKDELDPDKLLKAIREGTEEANKIRAQMGVPPMKIVGWEVPPTYNDQSKNLEWAIRGESEGEPVINYNTRLLGRRGVMEAKLVIEPEQLSEVLPTFRTLLAGYSYKGGESYAEYREGDKLAQYGLAALITGGAAAVALKTGLLGTIVLFFKKGAKFIIIGLIAIGAWLRKLVLGRSRSEVAPPES